MYGNVWEWVWDWEDYYESSPATDPQGPPSSVGRVYRGGAWDNDAGICRSAYRDDITPDYRGNALGFRLAFSPGQ
jgi:formylglycine-generating enzyme required for sulfatase activity